MIESLESLKTADEIDQMFLLKLFWFDYQTCEQGSQQRNFQNLFLVNHFVFQAKFFSILLSLDEFSGKRISCISWTEINL